MLWRFGITQLLLPAPSPSLSLQDKALPPSEKRLFQSENALIFLLFVALSLSHNDFANRSLCNTPPVHEFRQQSSDSSTEVASKSPRFCKCNGYVQRKQISTCFFKIITVLQLVAFQRSEQGGMSKERAKKGPKNQRIQLPAIHMYSL